MKTLKTLNWREKLVFTATGWHYGCLMQPVLLRVLLYPMGLFAVPLGALILPHYLLWPYGAQIPKRFLAD